MNPDPPTTAEDPIRLVRISSLLSLEDAEDFYPSVTITAQERRRGYLVGYRTARGWTRDPGPPKGRDTTEPFAIPEPERSGAALVWGCGALTAVLLVVVALVLLRGAS